MRTVAENLSPSDLQSERRPTHDGAAPDPAGRCSDWRDEVILDDLVAGDRLLVTTCNHAYQVVVQSPWTGEILVQGGDHFPDFASARLAGSLPSGSALKMRSVNVGLRLEFVREGRAVITTPVRAMRVLPAKSHQGVM
jgi:hypothetical protein